MLELFCSRLRLSTSTLESLLAQAGSIVVGGWPAPAYVRRHCPVGSLACARILEGISTRFVLVDFGVGSRGGRGYAAFPRVLIPERARHCPLVFWRVTRTPSS